jgi:hypothetical protein
LILVLDPMDMFVLKPVPRSNGSRGTVACCIPLLNVIAAAADHAWLHVAVKHPDIGFLIKNGNMALRFESAGTCLEKIKLLFQTEIPTQAAGDCEEANGKERSNGHSIEPSQGSKPKQDVALNCKEGVAC